MASIIQRGRYVGLKFSDRKSRVWLSEKAWREFMKSSAFLSLINEARVEELESLQKRHNASEGACYRLLAERIRDLKREGGLK